MSNPYSEENLPKIFNWHEAIRKRPGMYVGDLRITGFKVMLEYLFEELLENSLQKPVFEIELWPNIQLRFKITGIDVNTIIERIRDLKNSEPRATDLGLRVLISLAQHIAIRAHNIPTCSVLNAREGNCEITELSSLEKENCAYIDYLCDKTIFKDLEVSYHTLNQYFGEFTYLNPDLKIIFTDKSTEDLQRNIHHAPTGIFKKMERYFHRPFRVNIEGVINNYAYQVAICNHSYYCGGSFFKTYAGNLEMTNGGSLENGIAKGIAIAIEKLAEERKIKVVVNKHLILKHFTVLAVVKGNDFEFLGSTKTKLGVDAIRKDVMQLVCDKMMSELKLAEKEANYILYDFEIQE
ncbi:MAG: Type topoisomerase gyrase/topo topoisomerase subunit-like protein [Bacteroidetes bacterium]|nr:Type topoisomerase gyrase/topo topoisomerase subunit-like protein [Bacteroidota bacterium]